MKYLKRSHVKPRPRYKRDGLRLSIGMLEFAVPCRIDVKRGGGQVCQIFVSERLGEIFVDRVDNPAVIAGCGS